MKWKVNTKTKNAKHMLLAHEVYKLSQEEGLTNKEISTLLGYSEEMILYIKRKFQIPKRKIENRKDKKQICALCGKTEYIRRKERRKRYCSSCSVAQGNKK
ncbi:MAG: hypothetical protein N2043_02390 [Ignavibacterium sp.]|nr:hypothetical protein [Ignavibacterium sp.]